MEKHRVQCIGDIKSFSIFKKKMLAFAFLSLYFFLPVCDNTKLRIHKKKTQKWENSGSSGKKR